MLRYAITHRVARTGDLGQNMAQGSEAGPLLQDVRRWASEGVTYLQLREPALSEEELRGLAAAVIRARNAGSAAEAGGDPRTGVLIHTSAEVAAAVGADGVHLPGSWTAAASPKPTSMNAMTLGQELQRIRTVYRQAGLRAPIISASCHATEEVRLAAEAGVAIILFGPVFGKVVDGLSVLPAIGLDRLHEASGVAGDVPVLALGGVTVQNTAECLQAGAAGVAGIRLFSQQS